jgi:membrane protein
MTAQRRYESELGFLRFVARRMAAARLAQVAGSLTFTTMLALVPLLTIGLTVVSAFPMFESFSNRFKLMLLSMLVPEFAGKVFSVYMRQFADNAANLTVVGVLMLLVTAILMMSTVERTFNGIWQVRRSRPLLSQVMVYWTVLTLGPLILSLGLTGWGLLFKTYHLKRNWPLITDIVQTIGVVGFSTLLLTLLYRIVPARVVPTRHAVIGAFITGVLINLIKSIFSVYIVSLGTYQVVYGAFAILPIFLIWVYLQWLCVLAGAVLTASLSYWEGNAWRRPSAAPRRFADAIEILLQLDSAHGRGVTTTLRDLRRTIHVGYDELGLVLDRLAEVGLVESSQRDGWVLKKRLSSITLLDVFQLFVYHTREAGEDAVAHAAAQLLQPLTVSLGHTTLADFALRLGRPSGGSRRRSTTTPG